jgi:predicted Zn-dependent protease
MRSGSLKEYMITVKPLKLVAAKALLGVAVLLCSIAAGAQSGRVPLPDMGNSASNILSDREEAEYARGLIRSLRAYELLIDDPQIQAFFADMGFRLVAQSERPDKAFTFVVMNEPNVNAFAAPGGVVALHSGLILAAENQHEVAGVLAHEVAHITQLHLYRAFENARSMTLPIALAMLGMILAAGGDGNAISGALMSGQAMAAQMQINFTRHNEIEADRIGISTLSAAQYDPEGMATFFGKLNRLTRVNGEGPPEFLRTHPVTVNRIAEARDRAASMPTPEADDGLDFFLMQARVRALYEDKPEDAIQWFRDELANDYPEPRTQGLNYGLAIALQRQLQYDEARSLLDHLGADLPNQLAFQIQLADLDIAQGLAQPAIERMARLHQDFPGNHAIAMQYAEALLHDEDPKKAETASAVLRQQSLNRGEDPSLYSLYARAANIAGDKVRATEAIAESYFQRGSIPEAIDQLERLSRDPELDYYQRSRINARLMEIRLEVGDEFEDEEKE